MSSRAFDVRTSCGSCYFCELDAAGDAPAPGFQVGDRAFYMTARALGDTPERPLDPSEERQLSRIVRERMAARRQRRDPAPAPAWLWERMVHVACAGAHGFPVPAGETAARRGTRTVGFSHGRGTGAPVVTVAAPVVEPTPAPVAPKPVEAVAAPVGEPAASPGRWGGLELD